MVQLLQSEPERFYSVTQIGITIMSLGLGAIGISTITTILKPVIDLAVMALSAIMSSTSAHYAAKTSVQVFAFIFISALHIVGGELAPKVYAFHKPVRLSLAVAGSINFLYRSFSYVIWLLNHASNGLLRLFGQKDLAAPKGGHLSISEEELRTILVASESEGILSAEETAMIQSVFDLEDYTVVEVMTPRTKIIGVSKETTLAGLIYKHLTRVPEIGETVQLPGGKFTVEAMEGHRIVQVSFERTAINPKKVSVQVDTTEKPTNGNEKKH